MRLAGVAAATVDELERFGPKYYLEITTNITDLTVVIGCADKVPPAT